VTEATLKTAIFDWLQTIVTTLWVGDLSARPINTIAFVWHMNDVSRPATPILEGRMSNENRIGRDTPGSPNVNGAQTYTGDREEMLYLTAIGTGALDVLKSIRNAVEDMTVRPTIAANSFTIPDCQAIVDAHIYLDSMPEDRATLDMRIRFVDTWTTASGKPGIIETAVQTPTFK